PPPLLPPHPGPPPVPYTTLFRSWRVRANRRPQRREAASVAALRFGRRGTRSWGRTAGPSKRLVPDGASSRIAFWIRRASRRQPLDRKSTRLNSSHVSISYAVFCL